MICSQTSYNYQKIMTPLFTQCVKEVARRSKLSYNHRTLQGYHTYDAYEELFSKSRSNLAVVYAWLVGITTEMCAPSVIRSLCALLSVIAMEMVTEIVWRW